MWIEPSTFHPAAGELVEVRLRVGHPGHAEPVLRDPRRIVSFTAAGAAGAVPVEGPDGGDPAGYLRPGETGPLVVLYQGAPAAITLPGHRFEAYLAEEGLEAIASLRRRRGEGSSPGRERYSRHLKALLTVDGPGAGNAGDRPPDHRLGLPFELVAGGPPVAGRRLPMTVFFRDAPQPGVLVEARPLAGGGPLLSRRSDLEGRVELPLPASGAWLITAVHMIESREQGADWQSFWASLTLHVASPYLTAA